MAHQSSPPAFGKSYARSQDHNDHGQSQREALLTLSQDISALISLTYEATCSLAHDTYSTALGTLKLGEKVESKRDLKTRGESGRGYAVVVVGASEDIGQTLALQLAKSGYTVFPFVPLPSPASPPTSDALSQLLLTWSGMQKRLRARNHLHPGQVVPVIVDPEQVASGLELAQRGELAPDPEADARSQRQSTATGANATDAAGAAGAAEGRFGHAGETVRVYCRDNNLHLLSILIVPRKPKPPLVDPETWLAQPQSPVFRYPDNRLPGPSPEQIRPRPAGTSSPPNEVDSNNDKAPAAILRWPSFTWFSPTHLSPSALTVTDEATLSALYQTNVLDSLCVIRELSEFMSLTHALGKGRTRIIFVRGSTGSTASVASGGGDGITQLDPEETVDVHAERMTLSGAMRIVGTARREAARVLREELRPSGIDVCEVVVGPMVPRTTRTSSHLRQASEDTLLAEEARRQAIDASQSTTQALPSSRPIPARTRRYYQAILATRLAHISHLWAIDNALLYSAVKRAMEDRHPRSLVRAGLSPLVDEWTDLIPGGRGVKAWAWWALGRGMTFGFYLETIKGEIYRLLEIIVVCTYTLILGFFKGLDYLALHIPSRILKLAGMIIGFIGGTVLTLHFCLSGIVSALGSRYH